MVHCVSVLLLDARKQNLTFLSLLYLNRQKDNLKLLPI